MDQHLRLFFALWPDESVRRELWQTGARLHKVWGGRRIKPDTLHMTLVFLGETPARRINELKTLAQSVQVGRFSMELDRASCWRHNKVGFLGPEEIPEELLQLAHGLEDVIEAAGFEFDARPYKPHATLLRNTRCTTQVPFVPVTWDVDEFVLVSSATDSHGVHYQLLGRWPLNDPGRQEQVQLDTKQPDQTQT